MRDPNNPNLYSYWANNPLSRIDPTGLFWDGYETDWDAEEGYNGYLATEEDMAGAGTYDNSTWESSGESASGLENSKGFWESIYDFFTGRERKSDEEMAEEFLDRHTKELIDDLKNRYKDFEDYWSGGSESIDYALKGVMGSELLATAFGRTFDVSDYIYEDFSASALLAGALAAYLVVMGFSNPEDHLKALRNGIAVFGAVVLFTSFRRDPIFSTNLMDHILNKHMPARVQQQIPHLLAKMSRNQVQNYLSNRTFFNINWSEKQVIKAIDTVYNLAIKSGITDGKFTSTVFGEQVTVCISNYSLQTAYGNIVYTLEQLGF